MIYLFLAAIAGIGMMFVVPAVAATKNYDELFKKYGGLYKIDWKLLKALTAVESNFNERAINKSDPSYGLMQVLCTKGIDGRCGNIFYIDGWGSATPNKLLQADFNIQMGAYIISYNIKHFGLEKGIAAYNKWSARLEKKPFSNQAYVDKVLKFYGQYKNET